MTKVNAGDFIFCNRGMEWFTGQIEYVEDFYIKWKFLHGNTCPLTTSAYADIYTINNCGVLANEQQIQELSNEVLKRCNMSWDGDEWNIEYNTLEK